MKDRVLLLELLNKVCDHSLLEILLMRRNRSVRFVLGGASLLAACRGHQVSFNTGFLCYLLVIYVKNDQKTAQENYFHAE